MTETHNALLGLMNPKAENAVLHAMRTEITTAIELAGTLDPGDFSDPRHAVVFEAICKLLLGIEPIDTKGILAESIKVTRERKLTFALDEEYIESLVEGDVRRFEMYANTVKKLSWLRGVGDFAFWLTQELLVRPQPETMFAEIQERWQMLRPKVTDNRCVYGWETLEKHDAIIRERIRTRETGAFLRFDWPWATWNRLIRPLQPGFVGIIAAPDGMGKTTYLEEIAEYWASRGIHVFYVHLEDDEQYKFDRRLARHSKIPFETIQDGLFTAEELEVYQATRNRLEAWAGYLHYLDAAGQSMTTIVQELEAKVAEGTCQAVVFDYLDKVQPSRGQSSLYGGNTWERQADDMEQLKTFVTRQKIVAMTATQGNKSMQGDGTQTRRAIQGSGQKSQKAQLVIILQRELVGDEPLVGQNGRVLAQPGEYSPIVKVRVDKQNIGKTGDFRQYVFGEFFTVRDIEVNRVPLNETILAEPTAPRAYKDD